MTSARNNKKRIKNSRALKSKGEASEKIDFSDIPESGEGFFARADLVPPHYRLLVTNIDRDVLEWYQSHFLKVRTRMNQVLHAYKEKEIQPTAMIPARIERVSFKGKFDPELIAWLEAGDEDCDTKLSTVLRDFMESCIRKGFPAEEFVPTE